MSSSDFDQFYLLPIEISDIDSRSDVSLESDFFGINPIFSAPMKGISGSALVIEMANLNCMGILHRFDLPENRVANIHAIAKETDKFGVAIGMNDWDVESDISLCAFENGAKLITLDCANGYLKKLEYFGKWLKDKFADDIDLMCGNVVTREGARFLRDCGFDFVRVGIGGGLQCATRTVTGIGRNNLFALRDCIDVEDVYLIADGGLNEPGKVVKSFAFGADFAMIGSALAYSFEAEDQNGNVYGMASKMNHDLNGKVIKSIEGKEFHINSGEKKPLKEIIDQYLWGIRSACTYLNCSSYKDIINNCLIVEANEKL